MKQASRRSTEAGISRELFEMDTHLQECNHANSDRWSLEPLYAVRQDRYPAHTISQSGVEMYTRNVGHGQHAGGSREAPGGNESRCGSTLRQSIAIMGGSEFNEGSKMALQGNGLDDDWTMVLEMCSQEIVSLEGSCPMLTQQHHNKISTSGSKSSCLMPTHWHHNKHNNQMISNSCMPHAPMYLRDYPKVTLLGGPLSHAHLHRGNSVPELHNGFCQSLAKQHHNKMINATDFDPGDINTESDHVDEKEAICDELARHYAQHGLKDPEGYFDLADEEVQTIMSRDLGGKGADGLRDVGAVKLNVFEQSGDSESMRTYQVMRTQRMRNSWDTTR